MDVTTAPKVTEQADPDMKEENVHDDFKRELVL